MSDSSCMSWSEQDAVDKWVEECGLSLTHARLLRLKEVVTELDERGVNGR
jgi:hypothetical protein